MNRLNLKLVIESDLLSTRIFLAKVTLKVGQEKYLLLTLLKTDSWMDKIKDLNGENSKKLL